jgi:hypothetical protein
VKQHFRNSFECWKKPFRLEPTPLDWNGKIGIWACICISETGLGLVSIPRDLQEPVLGELVERANLTRKPKGRMQVNLLGKDYLVTVNEYDSFGESAFTLTLKKSK